MNISVTHEVSQTHERLPNLALSPGIIPRITVEYVLLFGP